MKRVIPINDNWLFCVGFDRAYLEPDYDFSQFYPVELPHNAALFSAVERVFTYTRIIEPDSRYDDSKLVLCFDGISSYAEVYINGSFVTSHKGDTAFDVDISAPIKIDRPNRIVVKVDGGKLNDVPLSCGRVQGALSCGIHREVALKISSGGEIADVFILTKKGEGSEYSVEIRTTLGAYYPDSYITARLLNPKGEQVCVLPPKAVLSGQVVLVCNLPSVTAWSVDAPALYTAEVALLCGNDAADIESVTFGFREGVFKRDGFYLNGEKLKLIGLNRSDTYALLSRAVPSELQRYDAYRLKTLGCNVVRTLGIPSKHFIDECDRVGLLVIEDIDGDGFIGGAAWRNAFVSMVETMVKRDRNHASVIAWGVRVGGSDDCDELYFKTAKAAHEADCTRPALGTRSFTGSRMYEDLFGYCDYKKLGAVSRPSGTGSLSVPYIVCEHTGRLLPTSRRDRTSNRREQARAHFTVLDRAFCRNDIVGAIGMGYCDGEHEDGVLDEFRMEKTAALLYRAQNEKEPFLAADVPNPTDGKLILYTNCDSVKLYRGNALVGEFTPNKDKYAGLKHPPIEITDFVGGVLVGEEGFSPSQARLLKAVINHMKSRGFAVGLPLWARLIVKWLAKKRNTEPTNIVRLAEKYALGSAVYSAEGIIGGASAVQTQITPTTNERKLSINASSTVLRPSSTYEIALVTVQVTDGVGNVLTDEFSPINVSVQGELRLIGDSVLTLVGGAVGFYVVTTPGSGKAKITVYSKYEEASLDMEVIHEGVERL